MRSAPRHGHARRGTRSKEYRAWSCMITRCTNPNRADWFRYGGRGISVAPAWRASFEAFLADVGPAPSPAHSIDRIDNSGNYEPGNVRWATRVQQNSNRRMSRFICHAGMTLTISQWAAIIGIHLETLRSRLKNGETLADSIEHPGPRHNPRSTGKTWKKRSIKHDKNAEYLEQDQ